jgi:hypothetical protein
VRHRILADVVVVAHFAFILFVLCGGLLALHRGWLCLLHLPAAAWGVFLEVSGGLCPLTPLENALRVRSGAAGYPGGFVEHYLLPVIYPADLTREVQLGLAALVVVVNVGVYACVARRAWRRGPASRSSSASGPPETGPPPPGTGSPRIR